MRKTDVFDIAIKFFGLLVLLRALTILEYFMSYVFSYMQNFGEDLFQFDLTIILFSVFHFLLLVAIGISSIRRSGQIARWISLPDDRDIKVQFFSDKKGVIETALLIAGLVALMWSIPDVLVYADSYLKYRRDPLMPSPNQWNQQLFITLIRVVLAGIGIIYRAKIANWFIPEAISPFEEK